MGESFDYVYDWTTQNDIRKRKNEDKKNNGVELKTTTTKDIEMKNKRKLKGDEKMYESYNSFNNIMNNNENKNNRGEGIKMNEERILDDKVDSRCCIM